MCSTRYQDISNLVSDIASVDAVNMLAGLVFGLLPVDEVQSPGLDFAVNESACEGGHDLFGFLVALGLACCELITHISVQF
jgi:hypothetical protein